jgi:hypothetical protein
MREAYIWPCYGTLHTTGVVELEGRRALRGVQEPEPERLATKAWGWGMSGPVRIQEQNRTDPGRRGILD